MSNAAEQSRVRRFIETAINIAGSEAKLGKITGYTQNAVWQAKRRGRVTAEMASAIDAATDGVVSRAQLRPDLFRSFAIEQARPAAGD